MTSNRTITTHGDNAYYLMGIPSCAGSLYSGTDAAPLAYREAGIVQALQASALSITDGGDLLVPTYLPRHSIPPIRNWPSSRIVWDLLVDRLIPVLQNGQRPLLVGGDCSLVVGTAQALMQLYGERVHVLAIDSHIDAVPPQAGRCVGAAAMGLWLLTHDSLFLSTRPLQPDQVTVLGWRDAQGSTLHGMTADEIRADGALAAAKQTLDQIAQDAVILLHFDVDVLDPLVMPAAYSPCTTGQGLTQEESQALLSVLLKDPRVHAIEVTEYSALGDHTGASAHLIVDLLVAALVG